MKAILVVRTKEHLQCMDQAIGTVMEQVGSSSRQ